MDVCFEESDMRKVAAKRLPGYEAAVYAASFRHGSQLCMPKQKYFEIQRDFKRRILAPPDSGKIVMASKLPEPNKKLEHCCGGGVPIHTT